MNLIELVEKRKTSMTAENAVSLLLPVAIELRNLHDEGKCHLEVSPKTMQILANGAKLSPPSGEEAARYSSGFAAPEIYSGEQSPCSDVYSFCAVLAYAVTGKNPDNSLSRREAVPVSDMFLKEKSPKKEELLEDDSPADAHLDSGAIEADSFCAPEDFVRIIEQGMALKKEDRTETMQALILQLAPYNTGEVPDIEEHIEVSKGTHTAKTIFGERNKRQLIITVISAAILIFVGIFVWKYFSSVSLAKQWKFIEADDTLFCGAIVNIWDSDYDEYLEAGVQLDNRDFDSAENEFQKLGKYLDSVELEKECRYRKAAQLADQNRFDEAIELYNILADENYNDAASCIQETRYRQAVYQVYELGEYKKAKDAFSALCDEGYEKAAEMIPETQYCWAVALSNEEDYISAYKKFQECASYADAREWMDALEPIIYQEGQNCYHQGIYWKAKNLFEAINPYMDSSSYLTLIECRGKYRADKSDINKLASMIDFEDAGEIILGVNEAYYFMDGYWSGNCGYIKFYEGSDSWWAQWSLPSVPSGTWYFSDGSFYAGEKERFSIYATSYNSVVITITATGKSYTLWRS